MFRWNSNSGIADRDLDGLFLFRRRDRDCPSIFDCLGRIDEDVHEDLVQLVGMTFDLWEVAELLDDADAAFQLVSKERQRALDALMNVHRLQFRFIKPREIPEASDDLHDAIRRDLIVPAA